MYFINCFKFMCVSVDLITFLNINKIQFLHILCILADMPGKCSEILEKVCPEISNIVITTHDLNFSYKKNTSNLALFLFINIILNRFSFFCLLLIYFSTFLAGN